MEKSWKLRVFWILTVITLLSILQFGYQTLRPVGVAHYTVEVVDKFHHGVTAFTQGLVYQDHLLIEGTGLYGRSFIKVTNLTSGVIRRRMSLPETYFGEGLTILGDRIYQITWKENKGFVYTLDLKEIRSFSYRGEGWGLTTDGVHLIMSNGSSILSFHDPETFEIVETIDVTEYGVPIQNLNELEYIEGIIFANIWHSDQVVMIGSNDGKIVGWIDMESLYDELDFTDGIDVLNGIAYNPETGNLYVTGKHWPNLFEVRLVPK